MPFDGIATHAAGREIKERIKGNKISRVYQPTAEEVVIYFAGGERRPLLLCANANAPRIQFTKVSYDNPEYPPSFCMILRKYLLGGIVKDVYQLDFDRVIVLEIESLNEAGNLLKLMLTCEVMGKHSNVVLSDMQSGKIIDAVKHISGLKSSVRKIMPNFDYTFPPNEKLNPFDFDHSQALGLMTLSAQKSAEAAIAETFSGISKQFVRSFMFDYPEYNKTVGQMSPEDFGKMLPDFLGYLTKATLSDKSYIYKDSSGKYKDFSHSLYSFYGDYNKVEFDSFSDATDEYYMINAAVDSVKEKYSELIRNLSTLYDKEKRKLAVREKEREQAEDGELYNIYGNLILSNIYKIEKGMESVTVDNFYSEGNEKIAIPLSLRYTPSQNANNYFRKYDKSKKAIEHLESLIEENRADVQFLEEQLFYLSNAANYAQANEVEELLAKRGYIKAKKRGRAVKFPKSTFLKYITEQGYTIYAGKNSRQNEELTFKIAEKTDLWLHVKDFPAGHVILKTKKGSFTEEALNAASQVAVSVSAASNSSKVAVDYTFAGNVQKIPGALPGRVTYKQQHTLYITPNMDLINSLKGTSNEEDNK